jgi:alpha-beta hydrolase superfamily lysophospholipase
MCLARKARLILSAAFVAALSSLLAPPVWAAGRPINLTAADGTPLSGMFYEAAARPAPAVVLVHMLGRSKDEWSLFGDRLQAAGVSALAIDLRGHGRSGGSRAELSAMVGDVRASLAWLATQPGVRADAIGLIGASLGANLAGIAASEAMTVRALALISPSLDYRGVRLDAAVMRKIGGRPVWLAASSDDPYALRSMHELAGDQTQREQHLSPIRAHGTSLLNADQELSRALVDWLRRTLIF